MAKSTKFNTSFNFGANAKPKGGKPKGKGKGGKGGGKKGGAWGAYAGGK
jgi:hypothetical protein